MIILRHTFCTFSTEIGRTGGFVWIKLLRTVPVTCDERLWHNSKMSWGKLELFELDSFRDALIHESMKCLAILERLLEVELRVTWRPIQKCSESDVFGLYGHASNTNGTNLGELYYPRKYRIWSYRRNVVLIWVRSEAKSRSTIDSMENLNNYEEHFFSS